MDGTEARRGRLADAGRADLGMIVYNPVELALADRIRTLMYRKPARDRKRQASQSLNSPVAKTSG